MTIGIYKITCIANGKFYIGSSKNCEKRFSQHKNKLKSGKHINIHLQRCYDKHGESNITYEVLCESGLDRLREREQFHIDYLKPKLNFSLFASGGDIISGHPYRKNIINKMKQTLRKTISDFPPEIRKTKYSRALDTNPNWQGGKSYKYCSCGKRIGYYHACCMDCKDISGDKNPFYGRKHSDKCKQQISMVIKSNNEQLTDIEKYLKNREQIKIVKADGLIYFGVSIAARAYKITPAAMVYRLKSPKYPNFSYLSETEAQIAIGAGIAG